MANATCSTEACDRPISCRGLCSYHYGVARRQQDIIMRPRQVITDIDPEAMTVTCPTHGPGSRLRVRQRQSGKIYYACRACDRVSRPQRRSAPRTFAQRLREKYGLSQTEYQLMVESQAGKCLICRETPKRLVVDHDHETKLVRGLLCHRCNVALGWMNDNAENLARAARYLRRRIG